MTVTTRLFFLFLLIFLAPFCFILAQEDASGNAGSAKDNQETINTINIHVPNIFDDTEKSPTIQQSAATTGAGQAAPLNTVKEYGKPKSLSKVSGGSAALSAVDPNRYRVEAGDELEVKLWTPYLWDVTDTITPRGMFNLGSAGEIPVKGVLVSQLSSYLQTTLKKYYKSPRVDATLLDVRTVQVQVLGDVMNPGSYQVPGPTGALDAMEQAGGLTKNGSLRTIEIQKNGKKIQTLDYAKWRLFGDISQNPYVEPNEAIYVPALKNTVSVRGEVERPGSYEILPGETWADLQHMAGGYKPEAVNDEVKISRIAPDHSEINLTASDSLPLEKGDSVFVPSLSLFQRKIKVIGEVEGAGLFTPTKNLVTREPQLIRMGWYLLHKNEHVRDVILDLGGFTPQADPSQARIERRDPATGYLQIIPVNLQRLFAENDRKENVLLQDGDTLIVPPSPDSVFVLGEVNRPGVFPYNPANNIREYLALAGGPQQHAVLGDTKLIRYSGNSVNPKVYNVDLHKMLGNGGQGSQPPPVEPGDVIYVPRTEIAGFTDVLGVLGNVSVIRAVFFH